MSDDLSTGQSATGSPAKKAMNAELESKLSELYHVVNDMDEATKRKNELKVEVLDLIKKEGLEARKFAIGNRYMKYKMEKQIQGLSQGMLLKSLTEYYGNDKDEANKVLQFVLDKRETTYKENIDIVRRD